MAPLTDRVISRMRRNLYVFNTGPCIIFADNFNYIHRRATEVNRQIGVADSKNVIVFHPLLTGHVIPRMRSGRVRIFNGNQRETL